MSSTAKPWIIYTRVSTDDQANGTSLETQADACRAWCTLRSLKVLEVITDPGESGKDLERPGVRRALEACRTGKAGGIVVWRLDRLTRSLYDLAALVGEFQAAEKGLASATENIDTESPAGRLMINILGSFAQWERETIVQRVTAGIRARKAAGAWTGGPVPAGCMTEDLPSGGKQLVANPLTAEKAREAWRMAARGASLSEIAHYLTHAGIVPPRGKGWRNQTVASWLKQERLVGVLIDRETFDTVNNRTRGRTKREPLGQRIFPLNGIAKCGCCGAPLYGVPARGRGGLYFYYRCSNRPKGLCKAKDLPADAWEEAVEAGTIKAIHGPQGLLQRARDAIEVLPVLYETRPSVAGEAAILARDRAVESLRNLMGLVEAGDVAAGMVRQRINDLQSEIQRQESIIVMEQTRVSVVSGDRASLQLMADRMEQIKSGWAGEDLNAQRQTLHALIQSVRLTQGSTIRIELYQPTLPDEGSSGRGCMVEAEGIEPSSEHVRTPRLRV